MSLTPEQGLSANIQRLQAETDYRPVLSVICGLIPQSTMTELTSTLQDIYHTTKIGGQGSRSHVIAELLRIGLQPNK